MSNKKYRLLKDLPDYKAGELFEFDGSYYKALTRCSEGTHGRWPPKYVENNPDWFQEVVEPPQDNFLNYLISQKEKYVKEHDFETASQWRLVEKLYVQHKKMESKPDGKYITLDEVVNEYLKHSSGNWSVASPNQPKYTEADIEKAERITWEVARSWQIAGIKLGTYENYKGSLKK